MRTDYDIDQDFVVFAGQLNGWGRIIYDFLCSSVENWYLQLLVPACTAHATPVSNFRPLYKCVGAACSMVSMPQIEIAIYWVRIMMPGGNECTPGG